jgi:hypothetical protein
MSRAQGKHPRRGVIETLIEDLTGSGDKPLTEGERAQLGIGEPRDIPGGKNHLANPPVKTETVPVPAREYPYSNAILAHGVEPEGHMHTRDPRLTGGQTAEAPKYTKPPAVASPVPVFIVEGSEGAKIIRTASPRFITVPAATSGVPVRVVGKNEDRVEVRLLNEDTATDIRIAVSPGDLSLDVENSVITGGGLLPWPCNSYLAFPTQDELYAIGKTGTGTPKLSIIEIFETREGQ